MLRGRRWLYWIFAAVIALGVAAMVMFCRRSKEPTVSSGSLETYRDFVSQHVESRTVRVWLPDGYQRGDSCDVLYMHDGQMLFDSTATWNAQEWCVDEVMATLIANHTLRPTIVVAIDNTGSRLEEYFPGGAAQYLSQSLRESSKIDLSLGDNYLKFIVEELKPFIDKEYRPLTSREHTFMAGSSMGGLISLYALCEYPQVLGGVVCMSSHLNFEKLDGDDKAVARAAAFRDYLSSHLPPANSARVYMDRGTEDFDAGYREAQKAVDSLFVAQGWDGDHFTSLVFMGHEHKERFWAQRLSLALRRVMAQD